TYFLQTYHTFDVCVLTPPTPPVNDECANAISLTVNPNLVCNTVTAGTTAGATESLASCGAGAIANDDVWFSFVATQASHILRISNVNVVYGTNNWRRFEVFDTCGGTSIYCASNDAVPTETTLNNLIPNKTYYIRY